MRGFLLPKILLKIGILCELWVFILIFAYMNDTVIDFLEAYAKIVLESGLSPKNGNKTKRNIELPKEILDTIKERCKEGLDKETPHIRYRIAVPPNKEDKDILCVDRGGVEFYFTEV